MRIEGKITRICELREGVSQSSGMPWAHRDIVVSWEEEIKNSSGTDFVKEQSLVISLRGDNAKNFGLAIGTKVQCFVTFKSFDYQGKALQNIFSTAIYVI